MNPSSAMALVSSMPGAAMPAFLSACSALEMASPFLLQPISKVTAMAPANVVLVNVRLVLLIIPFIVACRPNDTVSVLDTLRCNLHHAALGISSSIGLWGNKEECDLHRHLRTAPQARDTPDSHHRMQNHCRPQSDADRRRPEASGPEDDNRAEVIEHHRADQSPRGAGLRIIAGKPAGDAQCEQCHPGYATEWDGRTGHFGIEQQPDDDGRHGDQPESRGCFDDSGEFEQTVHGVWRQGKRPFQVACFADTSFD